MQSPSQSHNSCSKACCLTGRVSDQGSSAQGLDSSSADSQNAGSGAFDPSFVLALKGRPYDFLNDTLTGAAATEFGGQSIQPGDTSREAWQRIDSVSRLPVADRPFSASNKSRGWLEEASIPVGSNSSLFTSSLNDLPEGYSPSREGIAGDETFDKAAEEQTRGFLAGLSSDMEVSQRPFAAGVDTPGWFEAATSSSVSN